MTFSHNRNRLAAPKSLCEPDDVRFGYHVPSRLLKSLTIGGSTILASAQVAAANPPMQPVKPWVLDYADTQCIAYRDYGDVKNPVTLAIRPAPLGETYELLVLRHGSGPVLAEEAKGRVDFGHGPIKAWLLSYGPKGQKVNIHQFRISAAEMAQARKAISVSFFAKGYLDASFMLGVMPELLDGLAKCTVDLQHYWNVSAARDGRIAVPAKGQVRAIFSSEDYPAEAMYRSQEGSSQFLLLIDEHGKVAGCHVVKASGVPIFDVMGCQVIRERSKFKPALDAKGVPVRSSYVTPQINWRLEP
jgi:TonB family protein